MKQMIISNKPCFTLQDAIAWAHSLEITIEDHLYIIENDIGFKPAFIFDDVVKDFKFPDDLNITPKVLVEYLYGGSFDNYEDIEIDMDKLHKLTFIDFDAAIYLTEVEHLELHVKKQLSININTLDNGLSLCIKDKFYSFTKKKTPIMYVGRIGGYYVNSTNNDLSKNLSTFGFLIGGKSVFKNIELWPDYFEIPAIAFVKRFNQELNND
ncbi:hypothetical protein [Aliivibrio fischeri]|uniref:hypothetical protein n=1 Tax=Aliivibrio fischeri TaxID=668 RepID=UPI0007C4E7D5|nr:hypothetical protein [Aliivibrio fischeri]